MKSSFFDFCCLLLLFLAGICVGLTIILVLENNKTSVDVEALQEQVDIQQMRLDLLIDELKGVDVGGQVNWDRL